MILNDMVLNLAFSEKDHLTQGKAGVVAFTFNPRSLEVEAIGSVSLRTQTLPQNIYLCILYNYILKIIFKYKK